MKAHEGGFKEHGVLAYLNQKLYRALVKLMSDRELGRSYALLTFVVEGAHNLGYLTDTDYEVLKRRYSEKYGTQLTLDMLRAQEEQKQLEAQFANVLAQWDQMPLHSQEFWVKKASDHLDLETAKLVAQKGKNECSSA